MSVANCGTPVSNERIFASGDGEKITIVFDVKPVIEFLAVITVVAAMIAVG